MKPTKSIDFTQGEYASNNQMRSIANLFSNSVMIHRLASIPYFLSNVTLTSSTVSHSTVCRLWPGRDRNPDSDHEPEPETDIIESRSCFVTRRVPLFQTPRQRNSLRPRSTTQRRRIDRHFDIDGYRQNLFQLLVPMANETRDANTTFSTYFVHGRIVGDALSRATRV